MSYSVLYALAWLNAAAGGIAGVLAAAYPVAHPSWLTAEVALTCGLIVPITLVLAALLPPVTRTPAIRDAKYAAAATGVLPADVAKRHGLEATQKPDGTLTVVTPEQASPR